MSDFTVCNYCNRSTNDHFSNLCCHTVNDFIKIANSLYKFEPKMLDDFIYKQPVYLVTDSIIQSISQPNINKITNNMIPIEFNKIRKMILEYIIENNNNV